MVEYDGGAPVGSFYGLIVLRGRNSYYVPYHVFLTKTQILGVKPLEVYKAYEEEPALSRVSFGIGWDTIARAAKSNLSTVGKVNYNRNALKEADIKINFETINNVNIHHSVRKGYYTVHFDAGWLDIMNSCSFDFDASIKDMVKRVVKATPLASRLVY